MYMIAEYRINEGLITRTLSCCIPSFRYCWRGYHFHRTAFGVIYLDWSSLLENAELY